MSLNPNTAFNNLTTTIQQNIDLVAPEHLVTILAKKRFTVPWMTKGLIKSCQTKLNYYKKHYCPLVLKQNTKNKQYRNKYNILKDRHIYSSTMINI